MKTKLSFIAISLSFALLTSCGKDGGGRSKGPESPVLEEQVAEGTYEAILRPFNNHLSGYLPSGTANIKIQGDNVQIKTLLDDDARVPHMQAILSGTRCPVASDDSNGDGLIDIEEAYRASGSVFIPLDSDINGASEGSGVYPIGSGFTYIENASLSRMEADARQRTNQNLNLAGRVVLIHGVAQSTKMPETAATRDGISPQASVPIACGILKRM